MRAVRCPGSHAIATVLVLIAALAESGTVQEAGAGTSTSRPDRDAWEAAVKARFQALPESRDPATDPELVDLVVHHTWHAVPAAGDWLDAAAPNPDGSKSRAEDTRSQRLARVRTVARILAEQKKAGALLEVVNRVATWDEETWARYRAGVATYRNGLDLAGRGAWSEAARTFMKAARTFRTLGRVRREGMAVNQLATCLYRLGNFPKAAEFWQSLLARYEALGDELDLAGLRQNLATVLCRSGRPRAIDQAIDHLEKARVVMQRVGEPVRTAAIWNALGNAHEIAGRYSKAVAALERALAMFQEHGSPVQVARTRINLGLCCNALGLHEEARAHGRRALAVMEKAGGRQPVDHALNLLAEACLHLGRLEEALQHGQRALALREKHALPLQQASSLNMVGQILHALGRHEEAIARFDRVLALPQPNPYAAAARNNLGRVYQFLGRHEEAEQLFTTVLEQLGPRGNPHHVARVLGNLGNVRSRLGRTDRALSDYRKALSILDEQPDSNPNVKAEILSVMGGTLSTKGDHAGALRCFQRAREILETCGTPSDQAHVLVNLGLTLEGLEQFPGAAEQLGRALRVFEAHGNPAEAARAAANLVRVQVARKRIPEARRLVHRALDAFARSRRSLRADREQRHYLERWQWVLAPALAASLARQEPDMKPDPALAFHAFESLRGVATADRLAASLAGVRLDADPGAAAELRQITAQLDGVEQELARLPQDPARGRSAPPASPPDAAPAARRRDLQQEQARLEKTWQDRLSRLARTAPEYAQLMRPDPVALDVFQRALPPDTVFLAFALGEESSVVLAVDRNGFHHGTLPARAVIQRAVEAHLAELRTPPDRAEHPRAVLATGRTLHDLLLAPVQKTLESNRSVLVCPESVLLALPFETLVGPGGPDDLGSAPYLATRHAFLYVHSATVWNLHRERALKRAKEQTAGRLPRPDRVLVLADPVSADEASAGDHPLVETVFDVTRGESRARLFYTREEALRILDTVRAGIGLKPEAYRVTVGDRVIREPDAIQDALARLRSRAPDQRHARIRLEPWLEIRLGKAASRKELLAASSRLDRLRCLHVAAHAAIHPRNPGLSGMLLSPTAGDSGYLRWTDVMNLRLCAELVTLSGCETQLGKPSTGEGYQGLTRAFLFAGANNVLASCWRVSDRRTADLLPDLYRSLLEQGQSTMHALRDARRAYLASVSPGNARAAHPYNWGAWTLWGAGVEGAP